VLPTGKEIFKLETGFGRRREGVQKEKLEGTTRPVGSTARKLPSDGKLVKRGCFLIANSGNLKKGE